MTARASNCSAGRAGAAQMRIGYRYALRSNGWRATKIRSRGANQPRLAAFGRFEEESNPATAGSAGGAPGHRFYSPVAVWTRHSPATEGDF